MLDKFVHSDDIGSWDLICDKCGHEHKGEVSYESDDGVMDVAWSCPECGQENGASFDDAQM